MKLQKIKKEAEFAYELALDMKSGHIVQNKVGPRQEKSISYVPSQYGLNVTHQVPTIKLDKALPRKLHLPNAHDMRFENINRDTLGLSTNRRNGTHISKLHRDLSQSIVNRNMVNATYTPNIDLTKSRVTSLVSIGK
jgi:hypothetical protein